MSKLLETIVLAGFLGLVACSEGNNKRDQDTQGFDSAHFDSLGVITSTGIVGISSTSSPLSSCGEEYVNEMCEAYCVRFMESTGSEVDKAVSGSKPRQNQLQQSAPLNPDPQEIDTIRSLYTAAQESITLSVAAKNISKARALAKLHGIDVTLFETEFVNTLYARAKKDLEEFRLGVARPRIDYARNIAKERKIDISSQETTLVQTLYNHAQSDLEEGKLALADAGITYARHLAGYTHIPTTEHEKKLIETALTKAENYIIKGVDIRSLAFISFAYTMAEHNSLTTKYQERISLLREAAK